MTKVTFLGHSSLQIETLGLTVIVDPFISANEAADIEISSIKADYILVTHGHGDHILDVEEIAKHTGATIISNYEVATHFDSKGLKTIGINQGGKLELPIGSLKYVTAVHSSSFPDGSYAGNPGGFVLWNKDGCLYIAGDTALTMDMKLIPLLCPKVDLAILPIGDHFTMGYEEACLASDFVECDRILGVHYDTFSPITIDKTAAKAHFTAKGKKLTLLSIGDSMKL